MDLPKASCSTCNSEDCFEEINGLYYCTICNTQRHGYALEVRQYDDGVGYLREAYDGQTKKELKEKKFNPGEPWTMLEAYNVILVHQCTQLEEKLKLGPEFKALLFCLWANYLSKGELAFMDNPTAAKTHINTGYRDLQIIGEGRQNVEKLPKKALKTRKSEVLCGGLRVKRFSQIEFGTFREAKKDQYMADPFDSNFNDRVVEAGDENEEESRKKAKDDYGEDLEDMDTSQLDKSTEIAENLDLDDVPIKEWTTDMGDNYLYDFNYLDRDLDDFKQKFSTLKDPDFMQELQEARLKKEKVFRFPTTSDYPEYRADGSEDGSVGEGSVSSCSSEDLTKEGSKKCSTVLSQEKPGDIDGLKPARPTSHPWANQKFMQKARSYLTRLDDGEDCDMLIFEIGAEEAENEELDKEKEKDKAVSELEQSTKTKEPELTKRSKLLKKMLKNYESKESKKILSHANYLTIERMTMQKTLQFLLLTFRILALNVHVGDLIHWICMGHLTYFGALNVLPENWIVVSNNDIIPLQPKKCVSASQLDYTTAQLRRYLTIPSLFHPNFIEMITRYVFDLNLPLQLVDLIAAHINWSTFEKFSKRYSAKEGSKFIPCYEIFSICSVLITLTKIFGFNGISEKVISVQISQKWPYAFNWRDWFNDNRTIWKLVKRHYFPINSDIFGKIYDPDVFQNHRDKFTNNWFGANVKFQQKYPFATQEYRKEFAKITEDTLEVDPCDIEPPPFTLYHYYEAKKFVAKRISQSGASSSSLQSLDIFDVDYTKKSIKYLYDDFFIRYCHNLPDEKTKLKNWPDSIRLLIKISSFITNRPPDRIIWFLKKLEKHVEF